MESDGGNAKEGCRGKIGRIKRSQNEDAPCSIVGGSVNKKSY